MSNIIKGFSIIILLGLSTITYSQTAFQTSKTKWDGWTIALGYSTTDFLDPSFSKYIEERKLQKGLGYMVDIRKTYFPVMINFGLSSSELTIAGFDLEYEGEERIDNSSFHAGLNLFLLPSIYFFSPYIGAEYHYGYFDPGDAEINRLPVKIEDLSGLILKFGAAINFSSKFGVSAEYKRSIEAKSFDSINQLNATLLIHF